MPLADAPAYVIVGEWRDPEPGGSRPHPYGPDAWEMPVAMQVWVFRDYQAATDFWFRDELV